MALQEEVQQSARIHRARRWHMRRHRQRLLTERQEEDSGGAGGLDAPVHSGFGHGGPLTVSLHPLSLLFDTHSLT